MFNKFVVSKFCHLIKGSLIFINEPFSNKLRKYWLHTKYCKLSLIMWLLPCLHKLHYIYVIIKYSLAVFSRLPWAAHFSVSNPITKFIMFELINHEKTKTSFFKIKIWFLRFLGTTKPAKILGLSNHYICYLKVFCLSRLCLEQNLRFRREIYLNPPFIVWMYPSLMCN